MVYTSLSSTYDKDYTYDLHIAHLYGDLMNTYGDNGNVLMLKYVAEKLGAKVRVDIVSLEDEFDKDFYDIVFFGGGQDYEQSIVSLDLPTKKEALQNFIENDGVVMGICGGFQLLGQYYIEASGRRIEGLGIMGHYTLNQQNNRYIGDIKIHNEEFNETYYGFENHQGRTFLSSDEKPLGKVVYGNGNNKEDGTEGVHYKNVFGSYFHGPILSRNANLAYRLVTTALKNRYGADVALASFEDILWRETPEEYGDVKSRAEFEDKE
ncbi:lipid II isoglutaminyl synthase subunit GatD [Streptococcus pneumoniae]